MPDSTLVATLTADPAAALASLPPEVAWLEVRADLLGEVEASWLRDRFRGGLLYTLRSRAEGGAAELSRERRRQRLIAAAPGFDLVDLEGASDLAPDVLAAVPPEKRIVSWHGPAADLVALQGRFGQLAATPARYYKVVPEAAQSGEELAALALLQSLRRTDLIAFAAGELGAWTRLVAPRLGAAIVFGAAGEVPGAPGQPTVRRLIDDFGLPALPPATALCGVVGRPVRHSLSPRLHNALYRDLGLPFLYLPFHVEVFGDFWLEVVESGALEVVGTPLRGLSVTSPFKEAALAVAGASSPLAERAGAANTLVWNAGVWEAEATDPEGVLGGLAERGVTVAGRRVAVVGCGGAGRAVAAALAAAGAEVVLVNRGRERGEAAAARLRLPFELLAELDPSRFAIVVHATSLGRAVDDPLPFDPAALPADGAVVDLVYGEAPTPLVAAARAAGRTAVDGREVLLHQAAAQFRLMTGTPMPLDRGHAVLGLAAPVAEAR